MEDVIYWASAYLYTVPNVKCSFAQSLFLDGEGIFYT